MGSHDEVELTAAEQRALLEIEHELAEVDPRLGRRLGGSHRQPSRLDDPRVLLAAAGAGWVIGAVVMIATFVRWPLAGFGGVLVMAGALAIGARGLQARSAASPGAPPGPIGPSRSRSRRA